MKAAKDVGLKVLGWVLLVVGIIMLPAPGPGSMVLLLAMAVLSTQYDWAERRLEQVKVWALKGAADSVATWPRIIASVLGVAWVVGLGVVWGISPPAPDWWPLRESLWLYGGWAVGATLILSGVVALALIVYSFVKLRGRDFSQRKRELDREEASVER